MHQRVISLLVTKATLVNPQRTFSLALQAAASRAWSRQVSIDVPTTTGVKSKNNSLKLSNVTQDAFLISSTTTRDLTSCKRKTTSSKQAPLAGSSDSHHTSPNLTNKASISPASDMYNELGSIEGRKLPHSLEDLSSISRASQTPHRPCPGAEVSGGQQRPVPKRPPHLGKKLGFRPQLFPSIHNFNDKLLWLIYRTKPPLPLPSIIDYHNLHPKFHSTRSYNILLALALQHTAFATFCSLLGSMRASRIERNVETWKLEVRYLVQTGSWDRAWTRVNDFWRHDQCAEVQEQSIPTPIWLEFFHLPRNSALPKSNLTEKEGHEESEDVPRSLPPTPHVGPGVWDHRLKLLFDRAPKDVTTFRDVQPYIIRGIVSFLLRLQHRKRALLVTTSYLQVLPHPLSIKQSRACTDIINLHVAFGSSAKGLRKLGDTEKLLKSLLRLHGHIRPDANTLFLLLSPLPHAKRCGTVAHSVVRAFSARWGVEMVDERVRRRVANLAMKEGRLDLLKEYMESSDKTARPRQDAVESPGSTVLRSPRRILFSAGGKERQLWHRLRRRVRVRLRTTPHLK